MGKAKAPPPPDYAALASQQAGLNKEAFEYQTAANRVNQVGPTGSLTWTKDSQGNPIQTTSYSPEYQAIMDQQQEQQSQLTGQAGGMLGGIKDAMGQPLDTSGLTKPAAWQGSAAPDINRMENWGSVDLSGQPGLADSGFGGVEQVQQAMMSRLNPALEQGNAAEIQRLKAQGITEGSPAWQAAMQSQGQRANDANQQALLGSMGAYGDIFNRSLSARQQGVGEQFKSADYANALRGQQFGEAQQMYNIGNQQELLAREAGSSDYNRDLQEMLMKRQLPLQEYNQLRASAGGVPDLSFGSFFNQGNAGAADLAGAGMQGYQSQMDAYNAQQRQKSGMMSGVGTAAGAIIGGIYGSYPGAAAGAAIGGGAGTAAGSYLYA